MKAILLAALAAFFSSGVFADEAVMSFGQDKLVLLGDSCPARIAELIKPGFKQKLHAAFAILDGKRSDGCWLFQDAKNVYVHFEDGSGNMVPLTLFKQEAGV